MYRVIKHFIDLHDDDYSYNVGDTFPREGVAVLDKRIEELSGCDNKQHTPLIEFVEDTEMVQEQNEVLEEVINVESAPINENSESTTDENEEEIPEKKRRARTKKTEKSPAE